MKEIALKAAALPKEDEGRPRMVVFTQGALPTIVVENGVATEYPVIPLAEGELVDTNGAGDAFVGGQSNSITLFCLHAFYAMLIRSPAVNGNWSG